MSFYSDASLVLIPSGTKTSKVYSVKPTDGTGDLTFTRASTATRVNASGVIVAVASNVPRLDYSGGATCPSLLLEGQRTNLIRQSETFNNASWSLNGSPTITANTNVSPDGTTNADTIAPAVVGEGVFQSFSVASAVAHSFSVYLKNITSATNILVGCDSSPSTATISFNAVTGAIFATGASITSSSVTNAGNGWYRVQGTYTSTGTLNTLIIYGQGVMSFSAWGCQLEAGSFVSSYIPTTTAAVTRLIDAALKTGISSLIGQTEGVLFYEGITTQITDIVAINTGVVNAVYITKGTGNLFRCYIYNSSNVITLNDTIVRTTNTKIALAYKSGDSALFVNGVKVATSASSITFSGALSEIRLNDNFLFGTAPQSTNQIVNFKNRLTDAQCIELTTL